VAKKRDIDRSDRPPDVAMGARVKAKRLRFKQVPETEVKFPGDPETDSASGSERKNLPDEVEPNVTYRDVEVAWGAGARISRRRKS
jgi:hypothetical protein